MARDILIDRLKMRALLHGKEASYFYKVNNQWISISWHDYHEMVRKASKALLHLGLKPKSKIAILSFARLEWVASAMAAQYFGGVSVGVYTSSSQEEISYVVDHSDAEVLFIENKERYEKQIKKIKNSLEKIKCFIIMNNEEIDDEKVITFNHFLTLSENAANEELNDFFNAVDPKNECTMIYTSGTTGNPKAVMISHHSIAWLVRVAATMFKCGSWDSNISYLPLAHVAEQLFTVYAPIDCGMKTYFSSSFDALKDEMVEIEPSIFFGVPRVFEKIYEGVSTKFNEQSFFLKAIINYFSKVNKNYYQYKNTGLPPDFFKKLKHDIGKKYLFDQIKKKLGLGRARACLSGAAPISKEVLLFFFGLDIPVYELYGLSETTGPASTNTIGLAKIGSVGHPWPKTKIKLAEDGEILISGPHVFMGYYKNEEATKEVLKDGWCYTGDIGTIDNEGFLHITDRKKDLLITAGGKNISPSNIEGLLNHLPYVQSAVVVGDKRKFLCALLAPNKTSLSKKASELGTNVQGLLSNGVIHGEIQNKLAKLNEKLSPVEQIKKYSFLPNEFSIDTGELTPTLKIKRKFINEKYKDEIEKLYQ